MKEKDFTGFFNTMCSQMAYSVSVWYPIYQMCVCCVISWTTRI